MNKAMAAHLGDLGYTKEMQFQFWAHTAVIDYLNNGNGWLFVHLKQNLDVI
jgi:hypothetical protein